jgi:hypothetical protein
MVKIPSYGKRSIRALSCPVRAVENNGRSRLWRKTMYNVENKQPWEELRDKYEIQEEEENKKSSSRQFVTGTFLIVLICFFVIGVGIGRMLVRVVP